MRVVVTGGSGKAGPLGRADLREHGHDVLNVDSRHDGHPHGKSLVADLADYGQAAEARRRRRRRRPPGGDPGARLRPAAETFRINALSTYNVFAAAVAAGVRRVVWASSETVLGLPFDIPPAFAPIDETIEPRPESSLRALEARRRDDGDPVQPADRDPVRRPADLEHHGARRLRRVPVLLGRRPAPQVEPVGLRRLPRRRAGVPPRPRGRRRPGPRCASSPPPTP